ncbi:MAG: hypothetical protein ACRC92_17255 [Peptostreptococcaceae bacterium]
MESINNIIKISPFKGAIVNENVQIIEVPVNMLFALSKPVIKECVDKIRELIKQNLIYPYGSEQHNLIRLLNNEKEPVLMAIMRLLAHLNGTYVEVTYDNDFVDVYKMILLPPNARNTLMVNSLLSVPVPNWILSSAHIVTVPLIENLFEQDYLRALNENLNPLNLRNMMDIMANFISSKL